MNKDKVYSKKTDSTSEIGSDRVNMGSKHDDGLLYGRKNYILIIGGLLLIFIGLALMSGGHMPSPDVWDESLIYSWRRITLAPMIILLGIGVEIYVVFAKK